jgi:hypothetical protein
VWVVGVFWCINAKRSGEGGMFLFANLYSPQYTNSPESPYVEKLLRNDGF